MKLHLGCWHRYIPGFTHIDICELDHIDFKSDIGDLHFIENDSVDYIYCSHALEYKDYFEVKKVLNEWRRVLKPNGVLRIAIPDFKKLIWLYQNTNDINRIIGPLFGRMVINDSKKIYHKTAFDFEKIKELLIEANFKRVKKYNWRDTEHSQIDDHSQAYYPQMDKDNGTLISLNVECIK